MSLKPISIPIVLARSKRKKVPTAPQAAALTASRGLAPIIALNIANICFNKNRTATILNIVLIAPQAGRDVNDSLMLPVLHSGAPAVVAKHPAGPGSACGIRLLMLFAIVMLFMADSPV